LRIDSHSAGHGIIMFISAQYWTLSWRRLIQSTLSHPVSFKIHFNIILSCIFRTQKKCFSSGFQLKFCSIYFSSHPCLLHVLIILDQVTLITFYEYIFFLILLVLPPSSIQIIPLELSILFFPCCCCCC
jgi:hypothetical protein